MVDICENIEDIKSMFGDMALRYATEATFGNTTPEMLCDLEMMDCLIQTLERNVTEYKKVQLTSSNLQGKYVSLSSLKKQNNNLILDVEAQDICSTVEIEPCLSDSEICEMVEQAKVLGQKC